jgi:hypothetical protein
MSSKVRREIDTASLYRHSAYDRNDIDDVTRRETTGPDGPESSALAPSMPCGQAAAEAWPPFPGRAGAGARWTLNPTRRRNRLNDAGFRRRVSILCLSPGRPRRRPEAGGDRNCTGGPGGVFRIGRYKKSAVRAYLAPARGGADATV